MRYKALCLLIVLCVLLGCDGGALLTPTSTFIPSATPFIPELPAIDQTKMPGVNDPTAAAEPNNAAVPIAVNIPTPDGLVLRGLFYPTPNDAPGVLLLHMLNHTKEDWQSLAAALQEAGFAALAVDMRGHGATAGGPDWVLAQGDVRVMLDWLHAQPHVDSHRIAVVGASIGANLALTACSNYETCRAVVLLSPGLDFHGIQTEPAMVALGERAVLLVASEDDTYSAETVRTLAPLAQGAQQLQIYRSAGHGTDMFNAEPELQSMIVDWLRLQFP